MARIRFAKKSRYVRLENGSFAAEDEPESKARLLHKHSQTITYHVREWTLVYNVEGFDQTKERERFEFYHDEPAGVRLRCYLENDRRTLWSVREEGIEPIGGDFELFVVPIKEKEIEGYVHHCPAEKTHGGSEEPAAEGEHKEEPEGSVTASLGIPVERFNWIIDKLLEVPDARLTVSLSMPLYKEEIALAFDDYWMSQDFMLPYDEYTPINAYEVTVAHGPGLQRMLGEIPEGEGGLTVAEDEEPVTIQSRIAGSASGQSRDRRLDYILWLLAALVVIQLVR